ncbi:hypothetical protein NW768_011815 [Fusarium equiseti]|uniref:Uncharacterized protein n=1 Tax=Fusarium equiseti TaxID=61235 RepID=A0ABQ8QWL2_FUSEQ|nr:hypothetical protein NW768_011815 [Fusarium equiseti]
MSSSDDPSQEKTRITATSAQEQAVLEAARSRSTTTIRILTAAREDRANSTDMLSQQMGRLAHMQATLTKTDGLQHLTPLTLRSYFTVFGDIAKMWVTLSQDMAMSGLRIYEHISRTVEEQNFEAMMKKMRMLSHSQCLFQSSTVLTSLQRVAGDKQSEIMAGMESRIEDLTKKAREISTPSVSTGKAIGAGTQIAKEAAQKIIEQRVNVSALTHFGM